MAQDERMCVPQAGMITEGTVGVEREIDERSTQSLLVNRLKPPSSAAFHE
jgi:hypothetical protein